MLLTKIELFYFSVFIMLPILHFFLFGASLGRVKYRVVTKTRVTWILLLVISGIFIITAIYSMNSFMENQGTHLGESFRRLAINFASLGLLQIWLIILIIKSGEIRKGGISTSNSIYKWGNILKYQVIDGTTIKIFTNKKTLLTKRSKIIEWDVEEKSVNKLTNILSQHIKEHGV